jgi:hypothetical protein
VRYSSGMAKAEGGNGDMEPSGASPGQRYDPALFWNGVAWRLALTRHLDRFCPQLSGKTALRFQRL